MARKEKSKPLVASPKKRFDRRKKYDLKTLSIKDFAEAINKVSLKVYYILRYPSQDFVRELISTNIVQPKKVLRISDVINMCKNISDFKENLSPLLKKILNPWKNLSNNEPN